MRKSSSRFLALLLSVGMTISAASWDSVSLALEDTANQKLIQTKNQQNDTEMKKKNSVQVTLGDAATDATYKNLWELFADEDLEGDVVVKLLSDSTTTVNKNDGKIVEVPDRFTSLSFQADEKHELWIHQDKSIIQYSSLFANGKNITIGENIIIPYYCYIFGGSFNKDVSGNPIITIDGEVRDNVYGGGLNGTLNGNTTIMVNGYVRCLYGGGYAKGESSEYQDSTLHKTANVTGNVSITITENGQTSTIAGGGVAETDNTDALNDTIGFYLTANVDGSVNLNIEGKTDKIRGGGEAGGNIAPANTAYEAVANVDKDITILFGPKSQAYSSSSMHLFGGGYAQTGQRERLGIRSAQANVGGSISISVEDDATATTDQDSETTFSRFFGGGYAQGPYSTANVAENTNIVTVRPAWESNIGIVGGGDATDGGTANVAGQASITIKGIEGQCSGYENANAVIGGGFAGYGPNSYMPKVSTANVGSSQIFITDGANLATGGYASIIGGEFAYGSGNASVESEYDKCPVQADVENDTNIYISNGALISSRVHGGGTVYQRGRAVVKGNTAITIADECQLKSQTYGGGYAFGTTSISDAAPNANVMGSATIKACNSSLDWLFGSGYAVAASSSANVGNVTISLTDTTLANSLYCGGWASGKNSNTDGDSASAMITDSKISGLVSGAGIDSKVQNSTSFTGFGSVSISSIQQIQDVIIKKDGVLTLTSNSWPTNGIGNIDIASDAKLIYANNNLASGSWKGPILGGNLSGSGTIEMPAGKQFYVYGTIKGNLQLMLNGKPKEGDTCLTAAQGGNADVTLKGIDGMGLLRVGNATERQDWKVTSAYTINASVVGDHGKITPEGDINVPPGGSQTFTFEPEEGYKIAMVKVDGQEVKISDNTYTFVNVNENHTMTVSFDLLKHEDVEDAIKNLTPRPDEDPSKEDVLDVKIAYETLPDEEKKQIDDSALKELNDKLANLSEIEIKLETHSTLTSKVNAENMSSMVDAITKEEAKNLKQGNIDKITLKLLISTPDVNGEKISNDETEHTIGMQMDISVVKIVGSSGSEEKVASTKLPIRLVFDIPQELQSKNRQFFLLHKHDGKVEALPDLDHVESTLTAESNRFSPYAIAYKEGGGQDPTPPTPSGTTYHTIKATAGTGGTITPSGNTTVRNGRDQAYTITPNSGYLISDVLVDGKSIGAVNSYIFRDVKKSHTISVVFTRDLSYLEGIKIQTRSKLTKKKHVSVTWKAAKGSLDGIEGYEVYRSLKRNSGYGKKPFFETKNRRYLNNKSLKKGKRYYYKVKGYVTVDGKRHYTKWSTKAWRLIK